MEIHFMLTPICLGKTILFCLFVRGNGNGKEKLLAWENGFKRSRNNGGTAAKGILIKISTKQG